MEERAEELGAEGLLGFLEDAAGLADLRAVGCLGAPAPDAARDRLPGSCLSFALLN